jgi:uncharacterized membrane protein
MSVECESYRACEIDSCLVMLLDIGVFTGHLHPLIVHLPIGFLLLAILFELASYFKKYQHLRSAVSFTLFLGFVSAIVACISGYVLSLTGEYDFKALGNHKTAGIFVAIVSALLFLMTTTQFRRILVIPRWAFSSLCILLFVSLAYTGHQGANLTHGSDYISLTVLMEQRRQKPATVEEAFIFEDVVHPLLIKRCSQCHRANKQKGKLSMQSLSSLQKGGKTGPAVVAGKLTESELYKRITLDPSHEKFMPADGKTPLTKGEVAIIKWWIGEGMAIEGKKIVELKNVEGIKPSVADFLGLSETENSNELAASFGREVNADIPLVFNMALADSLRKKGVNVRVMLHHPVMLDVTLPPGFDKKIDFILGDLKAVARNVIWLNLSDNGLTENELYFLPMMTNLEKLRLEKNPIGDGVCSQLMGLNHLEAVNLNETKITSACMKKLKQMPALKRVYSWKTNVD